MTYKAPLVRMAKPSHGLFKDLTGQKFYRLTVVGYAGRVGKSHAFDCACECGNATVVRSYLLTGNVTRSCGCLLATRNRELRQTHGLSGTPEWRIWSGMKTRCTNPRVKCFANYGGRGITVCERWLAGGHGLSGFECFIADLGRRPSPKHSLERKDNDGPYSPFNCAWATRAEQAKNTRVIPRLTFNGETKTTHEWAGIVGVPAAQIAKRIGRGWSTERALTQPPRETTPC